MKEHGGSRKIKAKGCVSSVYWCGEKKSFVVGEKELRFSG
jgi:hypothetical protein